MSISRATQFVLIALLLIAIAVFSAWLGTKYSEWGF